MENKSSWSKIFVLAGSFVATTIGSGFATGQEIMQFFSFYGISGLLGWLATFIIFALLAVEAFNRGRITKPKDSMKIYYLYAGKYLGKCLDWFVTFFLFAVFVVMVSGTGATLSEYYGLNPIIGSFCMVLISFLTVSLGLNKLSGILGKIGPIIIIFTIIVAVISFANNYSNLPVALEYIKTANIEKPAPNALFGGILYACYNIIVIIGFLVGLGATSETKKEATWGGLIGAIALMLAGTLMYLAIVSQANILFDKSIPTLALADQINPLVGKCFSIVLLLGIYSTAAPLLWQCTNRFYPDGSKKFRILSLVLAVGGFFGGFLPFGKLVGTIYPYTGYIGLILLVLILFKVIKLKKTGSTGIEEMSSFDRR